MTTVSKRKLLVISVLISLGLHGLLIAVSPQVQVLARTESPENLLRAFHVRLIDEKELQQVEPEDGGTGTLGTRPGSITDQPIENPESLTPDESLLKQTVTIPQLAERLVNDTTPESGDVAPTDDVLKALDAKIVEISENVARQDIQVTRRLVAPSSTRIIGEGEMPTFRGAGSTSEPEEALLINPLPPRPVLPIPGAPGGESGEAGTSRDGIYPTMGIRRRNAGRK